MRSSTRIRDQVVVWLGNAEAARDGLQQEMSALGFAVAALERKDLGIRWARMDATVLTLRDVLKLIDGGKE